MAPMAAMAGDGQHLTQQSAFKITATTAAKGPWQGGGALTLSEGVGSGKWWQVSRKLWMTGFALVPSDSNSANSPLSIWHLVDNLDIFKLCTNEYGKKRCYCSTFGPVCGALGAHHISISFDIYRSLMFSQFSLLLPRRLWNATLWWWLGMRPLAQICMVGVHLCAEGTSAQLKAGIECNHSRSIMIAWTML